MTSLTRGLHSLWSRGCIRLLHAPRFNPAGCTGWIELYPLRPHAAGRLRPVEITLIFNIELLTINERHINHNVNCRFSVYREKSLSLQQLLKDKSEFIGTYDY